MPTPKYIRPTYSAKLFAAAVVAHKLPKEYHEALTRVLFPKAEAERLRAAFVATTHPDENVRQVEIDALLSVCSVLGVVAVQISPSVLGLITEIPQCDSSGAVIYS